MTSQQLIPMSEVMKHNTKGDCWVVIHGQIYDLTNFLSEHPGGSKIILKYAGQDGTDAFDPIHPKDIIAKYLDANVCKGPVDPTTVIKKEKIEKKKAPKPPIGRMMNVFDFEAIAVTQMTQEGWDYYSSGGDDEITLRENHSVFHRIWFRPRILVNVKNIDMRTKIAGYESSFPVYITATALGKLADPAGECALTRAAYNEGIIQMCPTLASCSLKEMTDARGPGQIQFYQLYVNSNNEKTKNIILEAEQRGVKALFITVDAPSLGRREKDMRHKFEDDAPDVQGDVDRGGGTAAAISAFIDPSLDWERIKWIQTLTKLPIFLKGVQCSEDALLAAEYGVAGIVLSNHGGRQMDFARSGVEILVEVMDALKSHNLMGKMEIYVDGGIRRGSDIFKCIALGATAVGIGRPTLYGLAAYGQPGVEKVVQILKNELTMVMRLMGAPTIAHITPRMVITRNLSDHVSPVPRDNLTEDVYIPLRASRL